MKNCLFIWKSITVPILSSELKIIELKIHVFLKLVNYLSKCIGHRGLALGQSLDLDYENKKISKIKY